MPDQPIKIIIVDDQKLFREGIRSLLKKSGIRVTDVADNGSQLLSILKGAVPDIVLLDLEMPVLNGSETLDILRQDFPAIKAIIMSRYYDGELIKDYFNRGACAYLSKDTALEVVVNAIQVVHSVGIYKENIPQLLKTPQVRNGHYYKMIFTRRETEIIQLICKAKPLKEMAAELYIAEKTVETHLTEIYRKAGVKNRSEFLILAIREGLHYLGATG